MTTSCSKKKKSSTSLRINRPCDTMWARTIRFHRKDDQTGLSSTTHSMVCALSSEARGVLHSEHPEPDDSFFEYTANQADIQHNDPTETNPEVKFKQWKCTTGKIMEEWLAYWDTYLHEMLHHNGWEGVQVTYCTVTGCGNRGDFSCYDCAYCMHYCQNCLIDHHHLLPFHRIKVSNTILSVVWHHCIWNSCSVRQVYFTKRHCCRTWA